MGQVNTLMLMVMSMRDSGFKKKGRVRVFTLMKMVKFSMVHGIMIRSMVDVNSIILDNDAHDARDISNSKKTFADGSTYQG